MNRIALLLCAMAIVCFLSKPSIATIIDGGNVNGFDTFFDENTGRIWMDMDSFFGQSTTAMVATANSAGFTLATKDDVQQLINSLPLTGGEWQTIYKPFMMDAPHRELIWGSYYESDTTVGWAWAMDHYSAWTIKDSTWSPAAMYWSSIPNIHTAELQDMNIWAYQETTPVPEPSAVFLLGSGFVALVGTRKIIEGQLLANRNFDS